jgi:hypothetical protein
MAFLEYAQVTKLQGHNTENSKQIFSEKELRGLSPNFHIQVSVSDLQYTCKNIYVKSAQDRSAYSATGKYVDGYPRSLTDT